MNISTIALIVFAWQMLANKQQNSSADYIQKLLNDDSKNLIDCVSKLTNKDCSQQDKTGALFQMLTNPAIMDIAGNIFGNKQKENTNDEGYTFETPSKDSQNFFAPINNIADSEIKHKLYWFYDNWYIK